MSRRSKQQTVGSFNIHTIGGICCIQIYKKKAGLLKTEVDVTGWLLANSSDHHTVLRCQKGMLGNLFRMDSQGEFTLPDDDLL